MTATPTLYTARDVARIFGLKESRVRYWAQTGFINPSGRDGGRRLYTFRDLVAIRAARELLDRGIPLQRVRRNLAALREALPELDQPLATLRVRSDGENLVVACEGGTFEPVSGQLLLDFDVDSVDRQASQLLDLNPEARPANAGSSVAAAPAPAPADFRAGRPVELDLHQPTTAYGWFLRGCALESQEGSEDLALEAYSTALEMDPSLAAACTNLGNLHYRRGEPELALGHYERACTLDPDQPEAHYNLANLLEEEGDLDLAISEYRRVLSLSPDFRDAHFNLALTLEQVGSRVQAIRHWERYLELSDQVHIEDEEQEWVALGHSHLARLREECKGGGDRNATGE